MSGGSMSGIGVAGVAGGSARCSRALCARLRCSPVRAGSVAVGCRGLEHSLCPHWIVPAVAPRVAPEHAPHREHDAPKYAVRPDRVDRVARAGRLVLASSGQRRRDRLLVEHDRRGDDRPERAREAACRMGLARMSRVRTLTTPTPASGPQPSPARPRAGPRDRSVRRARHRFPSIPRAPPARGHPGGATTTMSWPGRSSGSVRANASRSSRLTRLRSTAPPTLRDTDSPSRGCDVDGLGNV